MSAQRVSRSIIARGLACGLALAALGAGACGSAPRPAAEQAADSVIASTVRAQLRSDPELASFPIDVAALGGVVTLTGRVDQEDQRTRAAELAARVEGVGDVRNLIRIERRAP